MTSHLIWPTRITVEDNFLPSDIHQSTKEYLQTQYEIRKQFPLLEFNHDDPPSELLPITQMMMAAATEYILAEGGDPSMFELNNFQTHSIWSYDEQLAHEHIMEPHHDMMEAGYYAMLYYVDIDESTDYHVGGSLAVYRSLSSMDYPDGIVHVQSKPNRFVMFPAYLVHRVKPYFGKIPRLTIATLLRKERSFNQNKKMVTL